MGRIDASGQSGARTEKGRIRLEKLTRLSISEAWVEQHQCQSEPFHLVKRFPVRHAPFVEGNERQLKLNPDAVVEQLPRPSENVAFVALHVDLQKRAALLRCEVTPDCIEAMLLNGLRCDKTGVRSGGHVAIEHGENGATGPGIPCDVEDDLGRLRTERVRGGRPQWVAGCSFRESRVRIRERLERDDSAAIAEASQFCSEAAVARANVEDVVDVVVGEKLRTVVAGLVPREAGDVNADRLDNPACTMEQRHAGRLDAAPAQTRDRRSIGPDVAVQASWVSVSAALEQGPEQ
jgi:hypothetical protein